MCRTLLVKEHCERHPSVGGLTLPHHQEPRGAHEEGQPSGSQTECAPGGLSLATSECSLAPVGVVLEDERQISFVQRLHHCKDGRVETYIRSGPPHLTLPAPQLPFAQSFHSSGPSATCRASSSRSIPNSETKASYHIKRPCTSKGANLPANSPASPRRSSPTGLRWSGTHCPLPCRCPLRCAVPSSPKESDLDEVIMLDAFPNQVRPPTALFRPITSTDVARLLQTRARLRLSRQDICPSPPCLACTELQS
ncbi:hypothetical protein T484DRAFT_3103520 [Baffinella frigidus]|nr:hypothetical protein T484DRAFT_3103520 [Cryptophyta sp. CCMP2293]